MIFWEGGKIYKYLRDAGLIEACYFDYRIAGFNKGLRQPMGGRGLIQYFASVFRSSIGIYNKLPIGTSRYNRPHLDDKLPLVSEYIPFNEFPQRFAVRTKNIDLLRELIASGRKVSWYEPDVFTQAHWLGILDFENVFINPYINSHIIYPTGEVVTVEEGLHKNKVGIWTIKHAKKIGCNFIDIADRINWKELGYNRWKKKTVNPNNYFITKELAVNLYNIFSITYIIWRQGKLNATIAKKRIAHRD